MGQPSESDYDRPGAIYTAVIVALVGEDRANYDPWSPVTYVDATARSSAGPVAVSEVVTSPIPVAVQHRVARALAARTQVRFVDDPRSVILPDGRVRDLCRLITLAPVPAAGRPVEVGARSYAGPLGRMSCTFIVDGTGAHWRVTGTTGIYSSS